MGDENFHFRHTSFVLRGCTALLLFHDPAFKSRVLYFFLRPVAWVSSFSMAASAAHELRNSQLPLRHIKANKDRTSRKGKGKLTSGSSKLAESSRSSDEAESVWPWTSLTESSASNHPPIFTKDGRCVCRCTADHCCTQRLTVTSSPLSDRL
jgi:hypothetical protein